MFVYLDAKREIKHTNFFHLTYIYFNAALALLNEAVLPMQLLPIHV